MLRQNFAEQVDVWILDCPLLAGGTPGPSAGEGPEGPGQARVRRSSPEAPLAAQGASTKNLILYVWVEAIFVF